MIEAATSLLFQDTARAMLYAVLAVAVIAGVVALNRAVRRDAERHGYITPRRREDLK